MAERVRWQRQAAPIWDAQPPPPRTRKYELLRVVGTAPVEVVILNNQLEETWTHYVDRRTVFCTGPHADCWLNHAEVGRPRYGAWLAVRELRNRKTQLLRLTSVAVSVEPRLRSIRGYLRGQKLQVWRVGGYEGSEMHCRLVDDVVEPAVLLPSPDVRFCVERMLAADDRAKDPKGRNWNPLRDAARTKENDKAERSQHGQVGNNCCGDATDGTARKGGAK
jgi:hypothetical protein